MMLILRVNSKTVNLHPETYQGYVEDPEGSDNLLLKDKDDPQGQL